MSALTDMNKMGALDPMGHAILYDTLTKLFFEVAMSAQLVINIDLTKFVEYFKRYYELTALLN